MADGRCLRCGKVGNTGGCGTCSPPQTRVGTTYTFVSQEMLEAVAKLPLCPHGRRVGFHPCPWCLGINNMR